MGFKRIRRNACTGQINYRTTGDSGPRPKKTIMVKSITTIICGFLVLLSVSSCRKEQEEPCPENGRVTFTVAQTRATQEGTFEKGNSIGVFAIEPKTGVYWATNNKYTYDGRAFKPATEEDNIIVTVGTDLDFYVYYPFKEGQTDITAISHAIGDQQEKSGWLSADFLTASYTDVIQDYTIPLHFEHRLSTVEVRVEGSDRVDGARMENVKYGSRFNLLTGKTVTDETRGSYAMYRYSSGNLTTVFRMTIPAQTLTTTSNYITLTGTPDMKLRGTSDMMYSREPAGGRESSRTQESRLPSGRKISSQTAKQRARFFPVRSSVSACMSTTAPGASNRVVYPAVKSRISCPDIGAISVSRMLRMMPTALSTPSRNSSSLARSSLWRFSL